MITGLYKLPFTWREIYELDTSMSKTLNLFKLLASPQRNALGVKSCQVQAFRRPPGVCLSPTLKQNGQTK